MHTHAHMHMRVHTHTHTHGKIGSNFGDLCVDNTIITDLWLLLPNFATPENKITHTNVGMTHQIFGSPINRCVHMVTSSSLHIP